METVLCNLHLDEVVRQVKEITFERGAELVNEVVSDD